MDYFDDVCISFLDKDSIPYKKKLDLPIWSDQT